MTSSIEVETDESGVQTVFDLERSGLWRQIEVDGITSRQGYMPNDGGGGVTQVGIGHRQPLLMFKVDHPRRCYTCSNSGDSEDAMRWSPRLPIIRFTSNGLETYHVGE